MNTLTTIALWLSGSAVLQMVGFYCYSTYQKSRILKSISYESFKEENAISLNKPGGKTHLSGVNQGGKINSLHHSNTSAAISYSKLKTENILLKEVAQ